MQIQETKQAVGPPSNGLHFMSSPYVPIFFRLASDVGLQHLLRRIIVHLCMCTIYIPY